MTAVLDPPVVRPLALPPEGAESSRSLLFVLRWMLLGGAAGAWAGFLVGGVGGRLAMFVLRLTSSDSVRGIESDDGFTIGKFSTATIFLLALTTALGLVVGIACVAARSQLPRWWGSVLIVLAGGTLGAAALINPDGVDFTKLEPLSLACLMFTVIPLAATALTLWFVDRWQQWWWQNRRRTIATAAPWILAVPTIFVSALFVAAVLLVGTAAVYLRFSRQVLTNRVGRTVAAAASVAIIGLSSIALFNDVSAIL